jgi:thiol-disulfide isomerase/thioredoxin
MLFITPIAHTFAIPPTKVNIVQGYEQDILARAREEGKLIVLDFWADGCAPCQTMEEFAFNDELLATFANEKCIFYKVNIKGFLFDEAVVSAKYNVGVLPTFVVLSSMGKVLHRFEGSMSGTGFLSELKPFDTPANRMKPPPTILVTKKTSLNTSPKEAEKLKIANHSETDKGANTTIIDKKAVLIAKKEAKNTEIKAADAGKSTVNKDIPSKRAKLPVPGKLNLQAVNKATEPKNAEKAEAIAKIDEPKKVAASAAKKAVTKIRSEIQPTTPNLPFSQNTTPKENATPKENTTPPVATPPVSVPKIAMKPVQKPSEYKLTVPPVRSDIVLDHKKLADGYYEVDIKKINPTGCSFQVGTYAEFPFATKEIERIENAFPDEKVFLNIITTKGQSMPVYKVMVGSFSSPNEEELLKTKLQSIGLVSPFKKCL